MPKIEVPRSYNSFAAFRQTAKQVSGPPLDLTQVLKILDKYFVPGTRSLDSHPYHICWRNKNHPPGIFNSIDTEELRALDWWIGYHRGIEYFDDAPREAR